jgi:hypothetical protein
MSCWSRVNVLRRAELTLIEADGVCLDALVDELSRA